MTAAPLPWQHVLIVAIAERVVAMLTSAAAFDAWDFRSSGDMLRRHAQECAERAFAIAVMP